MSQTIKKKPATKTQSESQISPQVKFFFWGSTGLIILAALGFVVTLIAFLFMSNSTSEESLDVGNYNTLPKAKSVEKASPTSDMLVTKAPERQKIIYPTITFIDPQIGEKDAPVTIIEYADFNCVYCAEVQPVLVELLQKYKGKIRLVWKNLPITGLHPTSFMAAEAALCAGEQDRFWEYHDELFANQGYFTSDMIVEFAESVNINVDEFSSCLESNKMAPRVEKSMQEAEDLLIDGTPHFYINEQEISGVADVDDFSRIIDIELGR